MPKAAKTLSDVHVRRLTHGISKEDGKPTIKRHRVGGVSGLLFVCKPTGAKSWILRAVFGGKRIDHGLGGYPEVSLKRARELATEKKELIAVSIDPVAWGFQQTVIKPNKLKKIKKALAGESEAEAKEIAKDTYKKVRSTSGTPVSDKELQNRLRLVGVPPPYFRYLETEG